MLKQETPNAEAGASSGEGALFQPDEFHERLSILEIQEESDLRKFYTENFTVLSGNYGVLLFMYSVLMTKVSQL